MKTIGAISVATSLLAATAQAQGAPPPPIIHGPVATATAIIAAERAFAHRSTTSGAAAAYAEFMAPDDSLALTGGPAVHGAQAISAAMGRMMGQGVLDWTIEEVFASTGDLGVDEGRWTFTAKGLPKPMTGHYVTVWRKTSAGALKGVIDVGLSDS